METIGPTTPPMMIWLLLWLWVLLFGPSVYGSPLEIQLLEMMLRDAEGYPSNGREQRDISVLPMASIGCDDKDISLMEAASIGCDESGSEEHSQFSPINYDDYEESEDCLDPPGPYEPGLAKKLATSHPCFMTILSRDTPLPTGDPCAKFSFLEEYIKQQKKCKGKIKVLPISNHTKITPECSPENSTIICSTPASPINSTTSSPICPTHEPNSKIIKIIKLVPKKRKPKPNSTTTTPSTRPSTTPSSTPSTTPSTTSSTTSTTTETTTLEMTSTPKETTSSTTEQPTTIQSEQETKTPQDSTTTTTSTQRPLTENQLKRYKAAQFRRRNRKGDQRGTPKETQKGTAKGTRKGTPKVPDPPKIKLDGATQPSEVIQVILTTEAAELRLQAEDKTTTVMPTTMTTVATSTSKPETTTEDSSEDEVETTKLPETTESEDAEGEALDRSENKGVFSKEEPCDATEEHKTNASDRSDNKGVFSMEDPCDDTEEQDHYASDRYVNKDVFSKENPWDDTEEQDTNLCPQVVPARSHSRHPTRSHTPYRNRKPVKNYVEPILYEGNFDKPHHRTNPIGPPQRDYFVTNKQIIPRPRTRYRKRIPPSIYMNNIVRGLDCSDEVDHHHSRNPTQPQPYWDMRPVGLGQRNQNPRRLRSERNLGSLTAVPVERQRPSIARPTDYEHQQQEDEEENILHEERPWPPQGRSLDPCELEHGHPLYGERREQHGDYPQATASSHFFT